MKKIGDLGRFGRPFYTIGDITQILGLKRPSARVFCSRKVKSGDLLRPRRDLYIVKSAFEQFGEEDLFQLSNVIQTPSYISYIAALSYYGLTTQISQIIEAANPVRSGTYRIESVNFQYFYCKPIFYFGFVKEKGFFIAEPEKALLDILYRMMLGRYALDTDALDLRRIQWKRIDGWLKKYPRRFKKFYQEWRRSYENISKT